MIFGVVKCLEGVKGGVFLFNIRAPALAKEKTQFLQYLKENSKCTLKLKKLIGTFNLLNLNTLD